MRNSRFWSKLIAVAPIAFLIVAVASGQAQTPSRLSALTPSPVPKACTLLDVDWKPSAGTSVIGVPSPAFPANPWVGTDRVLVAAIRTAVDGVTAPDAPPQSGEVVEAYRAVYQSAHGTPVLVLALTYRDPEQASRNARVPENRKAPLTVGEWRTLSGRLVRGASIVSVFTANDAPSPCFDALSTVAWNLK
jgi:hypothetical protein